jgi:hypothetical protein
MLDHQVVRRQRPASQDIIDIAQSNHVDDVRSDSGRQVIFSPLSISKADPAATEKSIHRSYLYTIMAQFDDDRHLTSVICKAQQVGEHVVSFES